MPDQPRTQTLWTIISSALSLVVGTLLGSWIGPILFYNYQEAKNSHEQAVELLDKLTYQAVSTEDAVDKYAKAHTRYWRYVYGLQISEAELQLAQKSGVTGAELLAKRERLTSERSQADKELQTVLAQFKEQVQAFEAIRLQTQFALARFYPQHSVRINAVFANAGGRLGLALSRLDDRDIEFRVTKAIRTAALERELSRGSSFEADASITEFLSNGLNVEIASPGEECIKFADVKLLVANLRESDISTK